MTSTFTKRDIILIAASLMFMLGLSPFLGMAASVVIAIVMFFGVKVFVGRRSRQILNDAGDGFCAECGEKLDAKRCPNCSSTNDS